MSADGQVVAHCGNCGDTHPLGNRPAVPGTTECPVCGKTGGYTSEFTGEEIRTSEPERIREAIDDVYGVGEKNLKAIVNEFSTLAGLRQASVSELTSIKGVGRKTAEGIVETLS